MADLNNDIEKYLKGELSPAERHRLEKMALEDPFLAEALEGAEEITADEFQEGLSTIHDALNQRTSKRAGGSGWYWPMRIAAGLSLLICSTFLIWFLINNDNSSQDLALNERTESVPERDAGPIIQDTISASPVEEKSGSSPITRLEKKPDQPASGKEKENPPSKAAEVASQQITQAEVKETPVDPVEVTAEEIESEPEAKRETFRSASKPEAASRAKKALPPPVAASESANAGINADKIGQRTVTGTVIDVEDGAPLPGVNVLVKGTTTGTMTDLDGHYQIQIEDNDFALVFSFIGLETKEVKIEGRNTLDVQMDQDVSELSEVVVTGYGYSDTDIFTNTLSDYVQAEPEGGFKAYKIYLDDNLHYPIQAIENKVQGKVTVRFDISPTGVISDFQVTKGIGFGCDEEAIRLIRQGPKWSSPRRGDTPVKGRVKVRVKFSLPK